MLQEEVVLSDKVQIAKLPNPGAPCPTGKEMVVSGWGAHGWPPPNPPPRYLWAVKQACVSRDKCTGYPGYICKAYPNKTSGPEFFLCIGDPDESQNTACVGDSGGNKDS